MMYSEYIIKAENLTIEQADNGIWFLEPTWRSILHDNELFFNDISDADVTPEEILEVLRLEVEKRNAINSKKPEIIDWFYELINNQIEPVMLEEETEYLKNLTEYMRTKNTIAEN